MPNAYNPISGAFDFKGVNYVVRKRSPTDNDHQGLFVPTIWVNESTNDAFILTDNTVGSVEWLQIGNGFHFQESVIAIADDTAVPPTENDGDRYILDDTGAVNAAWDGAAVWDVVEFDGSTWISHTPAEGTLCYNDDDNRFYVFDGTSWNAFSSVIVEMTETVKGVGELATSVETIAGTLNDYHVVNPAALSAKLGTQTQYAIATGAGSTNALSYIGPLTDGQILVGTTGSAASGTTISGSGALNVTSAAGSISMAITGGGIAWVTQTTDSVTMAVNTGYITKNATPGNLVTYTLPASAAVGSIIKIIGVTHGGWHIAQQAGQQILMGARFTTAGVAGSLASTLEYDTITLHCITADTTWEVVSSQGNIQVDGGTTINSWNSKNPANEAMGGTGTSSYTQGDIIYASAVTTLAKLSKNASATRYLSNTGASNNPAWAQVDLSNGVTGVLLAANGGVLSWVTATANTNLAVNTGYITKHGTPANLLTYTLPVTAAVGTIIKIVGNTTGGWKVAQNASQEIIVGAQNTTNGVTGYIASADSQYNTCTLLCTTADTTWQYIDGFGTIAIV